MLHFKVLMHKLLTLSLPQVINHLNGRFDSEINALRTSYRDILITDIRRLLDKLNTSVNSAQLEYEATINRLTEEERTLGELQGKLHTLR